MTSATDELRALLDERGEDYTRNDFGITWSYYSDPHTATESMDGTLIVTGLTPEQAISATLGGQPAKLTAEQVREAIERYSTELLGGSRLFIERDWQAIADALNATLGRGTCKLEETESYSSERGTVHVLECSECGRECEHVNGDYEHCPHCLARNELF